MTTADDWWKPSPSKYDQGDIFADIPFVIASKPTQFLTRQQLKGGAPGFVGSTEFKPPKSGPVQLLAQGGNHFGLLLNHGCDIDKPESSRLTFAPVSLLTNLPPDKREGVAAQRSAAMLFLPDVPSVGDCYADLRLTATVFRETVDLRHRIASMTENAQTRLQAQILEFFLRRSLK